jgi:DNA-binding MarR family transcriptional regulator
MERSERRELEATRDASVGQLLLKSARLLNEAGICRARDRFGLPGLRAAHTQLFPHIELEHGTRLTDLAAALGMSKQGAGQLVAELVDMGALERRPDPQDGRAKRIAFVDRQPHPVRDGLAVLGELEQSMTSAIGADRMAALSRDLVVLIDLLSTH